MTTFHIMGSVEDSRVRFSIQTLKTHRMRGRACLNFTQRTLPLLSIFGTTGRGIEPLAFEHQLDLADLMDVGRPPAIPLARVPPVTDDT